jgi:hyaluronoglucosaminidase
VSARRIGTGRTTCAARIGATFSAVLKNLGPAIYGRHNEASGTTLTDYSGNGHNGTYSGTGITLGATSLIPSEPNDTAATYASGGIGTVPYASWLDASTALSLYAVIKTTSTGIDAILDRDDGSSLRVYQFRLNNGALEFVKIGGTGGVVTSTSPASTYKDGVAHHVGATYDGANIRLYVDGVKVQTTAAAGNLGTAAKSLNTGVNAGSFNQFVGTFDDWAVFNTVLADADYASLYASR